MNPLTLVKRTQKITERETALGISEEASWHAKYKGSAYIFVGGIPFDLTEGDLLAVFAQYGEMVDVNLVRDKGTGKSKGFAFIAYEDQRSTILAVDNLNGAQILGRIIRVDHVSNYKKKEEEDEETQRQKREARGVCRAFQRGECTRGAGCKFSHDEQRAANTGWGERDKEPRWGHDRFEDSKKFDKRSDNFPPTYPPKPRGQGGFKSNENGTDEETERRIVKRSRKYDEEDDPYESRSRYSHDDRDDKGSRRHDDDDYEPKPREDCDRREEKRSRRHDDYDYEPRSREDRDRREERREDKVSRRHDVSEPRSREDRDRREDKREANKVSRRHEDSEPRSREDRDRREERREDKVSRRHDGSEPRSREDRDRREEVREGMAYRRHDESKPRSREDRDRHERGSRRH